MQAENGSILEILVVTEMRKFGEVGPEVKVIHCGLRKYC